MLRRRRRILLRHGRELGHQLLALLRPLPVSRATLLSMRAVLSLHPRYDGDRQQTPGCEIDGYALRAVPCSAPIPTSCAAPPGPGDDFAGSIPNVFRARAMPPAVFSRVLAEVRRRLPHRRHDPLALPLPDRPAAVLAAPWKLTYQQAHHALRRVTTYVHANRAVRKFEIARILHVSYDLASVVVSAGIELRFLVLENNVVKLLSEAPD